MRLIEVRCIVQNKNGSNKYYPKVLGVRTTDAIPWTPPMASIVVNTNISSDSDGYTSLIKNDDIVRLQVNLRNSTNEKSIWKDIFQGRVMTSESEFGLNNTTTMICRGHGEELVYRAVLANYSAGGARTGAMLTTLAGLYLTRLTDDSLIDTTTSTVIPNFNVQKDTKFMIDFVNELESLEAYGYTLKIVSNYTSGGDLDTNLLSWQAVPALSTILSIIEGTPRLVSARFSKSIEDVVEDVKIYGVSGTPQKVGESVDGTPSYGSRFHIGIDTSIQTDQLCEDLAVAIRSRFGDGITRGVAMILGDPNISVGDLIHVKIPSLVIDGNSIDGNYRIKRLSHSISSEGWFTNLELGDLIETPEDILAGQHTKNRLLNANFIDYV